MKTKLQVTTRQHEDLTRFIEARYTLTQFVKFSPGWNEELPFGSLKHLSVDEMATAMHAGFEIKKPPLSVEHQAVKDYFIMLVAREETSERRGTSGSQHRQGWQSVKETLDILGIQIEGVNA